MCKYANNVVIMADLIVLIFKTLLKIIIWYDHIRYGFHQ
jgi:hypothetical protein